MTLLRGGGYGYMFPFGPADDLRRIVITVTPGQHMHFQKVYFTASAQAGGVLRTSARPRVKTENCDDALAGGSLRTST